MTPQVISDWMSFIQWRTSDELNINAMLLGNHKQRTHVRLLNKAPAWRDTWNIMRRYMLYEDREIKLITQKRVWQAVGARWFSVRHYFTAGGFKALFWCVSAAADEFQRFPCIWMTENTFNSSRAWLIMSPERHRERGIMGTDRQINFKRASLPAISLHDVSIDTA